MPPRLSLLLIWLAGLQGYVDCGTCKLNPLYPYKRNGKKFTDTVEAYGDDEGFLFKVATGRNFTFNGKTRTSFQISVNGYLSTVDRNIDVEPRASTTSDVLASFWNDQSLDISLDPNETINKIFYRQVASRADWKDEIYLKHLIERDTEKAGAKLTPDLAIIVTWYHVNMYDDPPFPNRNKTVTHQIVIASNINLTYAIFNYGQMDWSQCDGCNYAGVGVIQTTIANGPFNGFPGVSQTAEMNDIGDYSNMGHPGRIVIRIDPENFNLPALTKFTCRCCDVDGASGNVVSYDGFKGLKMSKSGHKYLFSKTAQAGGGNKDVCKFMSRMVTNSDLAGGLDWEAFSMSPHPSDSKKYKRNVVFNAKGVSRRGHGMKRSMKVRAMPFYEYWRFVAYSQTYKNLLSIDYIYEGEKASGWVLWSPFCQYAFYVPRDFSQHAKLYLGPQFQGQTLGLCQNDNDDVNDDHLPCTLNPVSDTDDDKVSNSCGCALADDGCDDFLQTKL